MEITPSTSDAYSTDEAAGSDATVTREFYVPATFQFSREPGRIERFVRGLLRNQDVPVESGPEGIAVPGTAQARPGAR